MSEEASKSLSLGIPPKNLFIAGGVIISVVSAIYFLVWQGRMFSFESKEKERAHASLMPAKATDTGLESLRARYSDLPEFSEPVRSDEPKVEPLLSPTSKGVKRFFEKAKLESFKRAHDATLTNGQHYRVAASTLSEYQKVRAKNTSSYPSSSYLVPAGTVVPLVLLSEIHTNQQAPILGQTTRSIYSRHGTLLIPHGAKVIGRYDNGVQYGDERVRIVWTTLVFPNGKSMPVGDSVGIGSKGTAGLPGEVHNHWGRLLASVVLTSTLSSSAQVASGRRYAVEPRFGDLAVQGGARELNRSGQQIVNRQLNVPPTIIVHHGTEGHLFFEKELSLPEYHME